MLSRFSRVRLCATTQMAAHQAPPFLGFSRQEHCSGLPFPSPMHESEKWKWSLSVVSNPQWLHGLQPTRLLRPWDFPGKSTGVGCHCLLLNKIIYIKCLEDWLTHGNPSRKLTYFWRLKKRKQDMLTKILTLCFFGWLLLKIFIFIFELFWFSKCLTIGI